MESIKYTIIKSRAQYDEYCRVLEDLIIQDSDSNIDEIELLSLLIEKWDADNNTFEEQDPIELLKKLMEENNLKAKDLVEILELSKGTVSKILNYQKGLSKETIRKLSYHFSLAQEAFNRPYRLKNEINRHFPNASLMNTRKNMVGASR
jgi:HTH-type transcriptional regulator/antitoxin HigA